MGKSIKISFRFGTRAGFISARGAPTLRDAATRRVDGLRDGGAGGALAAALPAGCDVRSTSEVNCAEIRADILALNRIWKM